jgi:hypothetical protein
MIGERKPLEFSYDPAKDWMTIEGVVYTGDFFRVFKEPNPHYIYKFSRDEHGARIVIEFKSESFGDATEFCGRG